MNEQLLRHLLGMKISLARKAVNRLPEAAQKPLLSFESQLMQVLYDISKGFVENKPSEETTQPAGRMKVIDVE